MNRFLKWLLGISEKEPEKIPKREAKVFVIVGKRGTGKSTYTIELAKKIGKPIVVFTYATDKKNETFIPIAPDSIDKLEAKTIYKINDRKYRTTLKTREQAIDAVLSDIYYRLRNATLIIDDASTILNYTRNQMMLNNLNEVRHKSLDIIVVFHGFNQIPKYLFDLMNYLVFFKTTATVDKSRAGQLDEYNKIIELQKQVNADPDPYAYEVLDIN